MRIRDVPLEALLQYRRALLAGVLLAAWPAVCLADMETPPPSRLRNPLSQVTRFLGASPQEIYTSRRHVASRPRREARNRLFRKATPQPAPAYAYAYVPYCYPYARVSWPAGYPYRRCLLLLADPRIRRTLSMAVLACMAAVATFYQLPPQALPAIYRVEDGRPGYVQHNRNGTDDLGSMQINSTWLPVISRITGLSVRQLRRALIYQDCFNVAVAGAILRIYLNEAGGDLVRAIGYYHSHTPTLRVAYQMRVMRHIVYQ